MKFHVRCLDCGKVYPEGLYVTKCENGCNSLLRTEYTKKRIEVNDDFSGIWKYIDWLPIKSVNPEILSQSSDFFLKKGGKFADYFGLKNLVICYNIYNPNGKATMRTGTFKDIEAELSFQRLIDSDDFGKTFLVSSDGNIATAFSYYSKVLKYPVLLSITEEARKNRVWSLWKKNPYLNVITLGEKFDYSDAIFLAGEIAKNDKFLLEGGTRNIARRDGIGTIMLDTAFQLGTMPDHYFQALGSGPGAIAMYESSLRLQRDGRFGKKLPKIHGAQNLPFAPMYEAWEKKSNSIARKFQDKSAKELIKQVYAHVLTNRFPHYSIKGGVFDVLKETNGAFYGISNEKAKRAKILFKKIEGIDIAPPAAVAVASLIDSVESKKVEKDDIILLNITGGQRGLIKEPIYRITPNITIDNEYSLDKIYQEVEKWRKELKINNISKMER